MLSFLMSMFGRRGPRWIRLGLIAGMIVGLAAVWWLIPMSHVVDWLEMMNRSLGYGGLLLFVGAYIITTVLFLPGITLTIAAGAIFGLGWGLVAVSVGSTLGAASAMLIARYLLRPRIERRFASSPMFKAMDAAIHEGGWKVVALLRLSPMIPFNVQNYLYGLTSVRFWPCILTSWIAMLPGTFLYVYFGYAGRAGLAAVAGGGPGRTLGQWVMLSVGLAATVGVTVYMTWLARRAMRRQSPFVSPRASAQANLQTAMD